MNLINPLTLKRLVLSFLLICLIWYWFSGLSIHHLYNSPFSYKAADLIYYLLESIGIIQLITFSKLSSVLFDVLLIGLVLYSLIFIKNRKSMIMTSIFLLIYHVVLNYKLGYHAHHLFGFHFALFPFCFKNKFGLAFNFSRYLACLTYFFAGFFKFYNKAWIDLTSFSEVFQSQHAAFFYFNPNHQLYHLSVFFQNHPILGLLIFNCGMFLQLFFIVGFFTKRFDLILGFGILVFHIMDWYLMNLGIFFSMTVLVYLFFYSKNKFELNDPNT